MLREESVKTEATDAPPRRLATQAAVLVCRLVHRSDWALLPGQGQYRRALLKGVVEIGATFTGVPKVDACTIKPSPM